MKLLSITWQSYFNMLYRASKNIKEFELKVYSSRALQNDPDRLSTVMDEIESADILFLYRSNEPIWDEIERKIKDPSLKAKIVCLGHDPSYWRLSNVEPEVLSTAYRYMVINGEKNITNMCRFLAKRLLGFNIYYEDPEELPWEGLYHPEADRIFKDINEYLRWYESNFPLRRGLPTVGILFSRHYWINGNTEVEDMLIGELERLNLRVISGFAYSVKDTALGTKGSGEVIEEWFLDGSGRSRIDAFIKLISFFLGTSREKGYNKSETAVEGVELLKRLNIPCFCPISSYYKTISEWEEQELNMDIGWSVSLPEFEGTIEPIIISAQLNGEADERKKMPIEDRVKKLALRVKRWIKLRDRPIQDRRISIVLHNNPCASVEATVGVAAHLDSLESAVEIMKRMKDEGYKIEDVPESGKELIEEIMERKALSEFRWTTVEEIVQKGGAIDLVSLQEYLNWFSELPFKAQKRMIDAWGEPPGRYKDGVPPSMLYDDKIVITGLRFGNVTLHVQPKRGCAGPRCDGKVCKILHDPDIPPPHQYIATYRWITRKFKADAILHVGTHGNLEFLPGKGVALSSGCFPDIGIDTIPHLYIYNADNPPEGTIAKRRSLAVLVDHMQTALTESALYGRLEELENLVGQYEMCKQKDPSRLHALSHLIMDALKDSALDKEIRIRWKGRYMRLSDLSQDEVHEIPFDLIVEEVHGRLSLIRNTQIQDGMHVFGRIPEGERRAELIYSIMRYDSEKEVSLREEIARLLGYRLEDLLKDQKRWDASSGKSYGAILEIIDRIGKEVIKEVINAGY